MIARLQTQEVERLLATWPAVGLLGPRQVGKTTLARDLAETRPSIYLDLESEADLAKLAEPELYLREHEDKLVVLDEIQRAPEVFRTLRGLIDDGRRKGLKSGRFLVLGSASLELLQQSSESLAGRIHYLELPTLSPLEIERAALDQLWLRGGFPDSFLASSDAASMEWRRAFIRTYLERDIPQLGPRIPAETLRRFWTMLAHLQGSLLNAAKMAAGLGVSGQTVARYLDLLVDLLLVRRLSPWAANTGKRLVRSPKVYVRDSGITHALLGIDSFENLLGHPVAGPSWEGFVVESLLNAAPDGTEASFYRTSGGAEVDLVLSLPGDEVWAIEIKRSLSPSPTRGFHNAREDLRPAAAWIVYPGEEAFPVGEGIRAVGVVELTELVHRKSG